jgi:hypothetical protein
VCLVGGCVMVVGVCVVDLGFCFCLLFVFC